MIDWPFENFWEDLKNLLLWVPRRVWELILEGLAFVISSIPVPSWWSGISGLFAQLPNGVAWGFWLFNFGFGLGVIVSAYALRFAIRRLPLVG